MQISRKMMVAFKTADLFHANKGLSTQPRKQGLFFICCVPFATYVKILKRSLYSRPLFTGKAPGVRTLGDQAHDVEEVLNPAMTVFQHANRIIESAIWFCTYLYCHRATFVL